MNTHHRKSLVAVGCGLALTFGAGAARAESSGMDWLGIVYLWAADIGVDTRDVNLDVDFSDTIDKLEMGFQGHMEAQGDDFGGFVDISYMAVGNNNNLPNVHLNSDLDMTAMDLAMVWSPGPERMTGFEALWRPALHRHQFPSRGRSRAAGAANGRDRRQLDLHRSLDRRALRPAAQ